MRRITKFRNHSRTSGELGLIKESDLTNNARTLAITVN